MKFVVIDDDPTGSQTVCDCLLLLKWDCSTLVKGFESKSNLFFILANTRSRSENDAQKEEHLMVAQRMRIRLFLLDPNLQITPQILIQKVSEFTLMNM